MKPQSRLRAVALPKYIEIVGVAKHERKETMKESLLSLSHSRQKFCRGVPHSEECWRECQIRSSTSGCCSTTPCLLGLRTDGKGLSGSFTTGAPALEMKGEESLIEISTKELSTNMIQLYRG